MSICHDCGDICFGMVMVAVLPSARRAAANPHEYRTGVMTHNVVERRADPVY